MSVLVRTFTAVAKCWREQLQEEGAFCSWSNLSRRESMVSREAEREPGLAHWLPSFPLIPSGSPAYTMPLHTFGGSLSP